jgi:hypothetical protein
MAILVVSIVGIEGICRVQLTIYLNKLEDFKESILPIYRCDRMIWKGGINGFTV